MPSDAHRLLVERGDRWLAANGWPVRATELTCLGPAERVDNVGFRNRVSIVLEAKVSRADFLADRKKPHRVCDGIGLYRFFTCPVGLIAPADLPQGWGLLYVDGNRVVDVVRPTGNLWPQYGDGPAEWRRFQHLRSIEHENAVLYSIARRRAQAERTQDR